VANDTRYTQALVSTEHGVLWVLSGALVSVDDSGVAGELTTGTIVDAAARADEMFWIDYAEGEGYAVRGMPRAGGSATTWYVGEATRLAASDGGVFITEPGEAGVRIARLDSAGGSATSLATEPESLSGGLEATNDHVYWLTSSGVVKRVAVAGGNVETLGTDLSGGFLADDSAVFGFSQTFDYALVRLTFGGDRSEIVTSDRQALGLTTSATGVYWIDWQSECLAYDMQGKHQTCVEYADELRVWAVAK
jgi:hypothetical protein